MLQRLLALSVVATIAATALLPGSSFWVRPEVKPFPLRASKIPLDDSGLPLLGTSGSLVATARQPEAIVYTEPSRTSTVATTLDNPTQTDGPLVFQVVKHQPGWLQIKLPVRPNGSTGWIPQSQVELRVNRFKVLIDTSEHQLQVLYQDEIRLTTEVAIGDGATPTPIGSFYLTELLQPEDPTGIYGPFAFGLSGFSETLRSFNGGDGVIGLHGTDDPTSLGSDVSHGCVRIHNDTITELASFLPLGTPVEIT